MRSILLAAVLLAAGCSHFTVEDARWVHANAKNIDDVYDRLGDRPWAVRFGEGYEEDQWFDHGHHALWVCICVPVLGLAYYPFDATLDDHLRAVTVRFEPKTGNIISISDELPEMAKPYAGR